MNTQPNSEDLQGDLTPERFQENEQRLDDQLQKTDKKKSKKNLLSIETMDIYEQKKLVNSPKTLEACRREGVVPKELRFIPKDKFKDQSMPEEVTEMRYQFNENKRLELVKIVKRTRIKLLGRKKHTQSTHDMKTMQ